MASNNSNLEGTMYNYRVAVELEGEQGKFISEFTVPANSEEEAQMYAPAEAGQKEFFIRVISVRRVA